ncbi:ATP-binding protein [bacterium]|nr:ATP-binding protein [bacterium]
MQVFAKKKTVVFPEYLPFDEQHYRELRRRTTVRLLLLYLAPVVLLAAYFYFQYGSIVSESHRLHLRAIAESQAKTLDLFLSERLVNLSNVVDDPRLTFPPSQAVMEASLQKLQRNSDAFVDVGFFDSAGVLVSYAGPYPSLEMRSYRSESWYRTLRESENSYIFTDIYLGFRNRPHFTMAISRTIAGQVVVFRATLDPERIYDYISSTGDGQDVSTSIINRSGHFQLVAPRLGKPLESSGILPEREPSLGFMKANLGSGGRVSLAYSWLRTADWALLVQEARNDGSDFSTGYRFRIAGIAAVMIFVGLIIIIVRARRQVELQIETDRTRAQLEHAAKLASVGELAAGIAHEINNPLASINEEAGLVLDLTDPEYGEAMSTDELRAHLKSIQALVFRCRDITHKLLGFVRKTEMDLREHNVHMLIDGVVDGLLGPEVAVSNVQIKRHYTPEPVIIMTDGNQLQQVILNIVNNGIDATAGHGGRIVITTRTEEKRVFVSIADNGKGMTPDQLEKIFIPFYTTKEVGKGTGLGLSVSYGIVKNLGGEIQVESIPGKGSTFTLVLPTRQ